MAKSKSSSVRSITESSGAVPQAELDSLKAFLPAIGNLTFVRATPSAVTTAWGVKWDEELVSRDLLQNFRDANKESIDRITISSRNGDVLIHGPAEFNLNRLYYLGSEKSAGDNDIGQYGEGFKAASLALLRDFKVTPFVISGKNLIRLSVSKETVEDTNLRPIIYEFFTHDGDVSGSYMLILGCSKELSCALETGLEHFFWLGHPKVGERVFSNAALDVYRSNSSDGFGFYQGLRRVTIHSIPLIFNLKKSYKNLDKKIEQDRDRKAFDEKLAGLFYGLVAKQQDQQTDRLVLSLTKPIWHKGHPLLSRIAETYSHLPDHHGDMLHEMFGDLFEPNRYFAKIENQWWLQEHPEAKAFNEKFISEGRIGLPGYFVSFGIPNARTASKIESARVAQAIREAPNTKPTALEMMAIQFMVNIVKGLSRELENLATQTRYTYLVAHTDEIMGQLRSSTRHRAAEVILASAMFLEPFHTAISTLIHEWAHAFGYDGDRFFTDALTNVLESVIENRDRLGEAEAWWNNHRRLIQEERLSPNRSPRARLLTMPDTELQELISKAPESLLAQLLAEDCAQPARPNVNSDSSMSECLTSMVPGDRVLLLLTRSAINPTAGSDTDVVVSPVFSFVSFEPTTMSITIAMPSGECQTAVVSTSESPNAIIAVKGRTFDVFLNKVERQNTPRLSSRAQYAGEIMVALETANNNRFLFIDAAGKQHQLISRFDLNELADDEPPDIGGIDTVFLYCEEGGHLDRIAITPNRRGASQIRVRNLVFPCDAILMSEVHYELCNDHGYHIEPFGDGFCQAVVLQRRPDLVLKYLNRCAAVHGIPPYPDDCKANVLRYGLLAVARDGESKTMDIHDFSDFSASRIGLPSIPAFFNLSLDIEKADFNVGDDVLFFTDIWDDDIGTIRRVTDFLGDDSEGFPLWLLDDEFEADKLDLYRVPSDSVGLKPGIFG